MKKLIFILIVFQTLLANAQQSTNAPFIHSHNDYLQEKPLIGALAAKAKSIEIDLFLKNETLYVAHTRLGIKKQNTFENVYITPLQKHLIETDAFRDFHFMIDVKTEAEPTLDAIQKTLKKYPEIFSTNGIQAIISGNRPDPSSYTKYADFIWFDGRTPNDATNEKVAVVSQNFTKFTQWNGKGEIPIVEKTKLLDFIEASHTNNKPVRFWKTKDNQQVYDFLIEIGVDYINTDFPEKVRDFLNQE